jgi:hypothetical protein
MNNIQLWKWRVLQVIQLLQAQAATLLEKHKTTAYEILKLHSQKLASNKKFLVHIF